MSAGVWSRHVFPVGTADLAKSGSKLEPVCGLCRYRDDVGDIAINGTPEHHSPSGSKKFSRSVPKSDSLCKVASLEATPRFVAAIILAASSHKTETSKLLSPKQSHVAALCSTLWDDALACYDDDSLSRKYGRLETLADKMECIEIHFHKSCRKHVARCANAVVGLTCDKTASQMRSSNALEQADARMMQHAAALQAVAENALELLGDVAADRDTVPFADVVARYTSLRALAGDGGEDDDDGGSDILFGDAELMSEEEDGTDEFSPNKASPAMPSQPPSLGATARRHAKEAATEAATDATYHGAPPASSTASSNALDGMQNHGWLRSSLERWIENTKPMARGEAMILMSTANLGGGSRPRYYLALSGWAARAARRAAAPAATDEVDNDFMIIRPEPAELTLYHHSLLQAVMRPLGPKLMRHYILSELGPIEVMRRGRPTQFAQEPDSDRVDVTPRQSEGSTTSVLEPGEVLAEVERTLRAAEERGQTYAEFLAEFGADSAALFPTVWQGYQQAWPEAAAAALSTKVGNVLPGAAEPDWHVQPQQLSLTYAFGLVGVDAYRHVYLAKHPGTAEDQVPKPEWVCNPENMGSKGHSQAIEALNMAQYQHHYLYKELTPLHWANGLLTRRLVMNDALAEQLERTGCSAPARVIRNQAHTAAHRMQKDQYSQLRALSHVAGRQLKVVADNVDFANIDSRKGGTHVLQVEAVVKTDEDPNQSRAYRDTVAEEGRLAAKEPVQRRVPTTSNRPSKKMPKDPKANPPSASRFDAPKVKLRLDGDRFSIIPHEDDSDGGSTRFLSAHFPASFSAWLHQRHGDDVGAIVESLVQAAGNRLLWCAVLTGCPKLEESWPSYVTHCQTTVGAASDPGTFLEGFVGGLGKTWSGRNNEVGYAMAVAKLGVSATPRYGDARKRAVSGEKDAFDRYEREIEFAQINKPPNSDGAICDLFDIILESMDALDVPEAILVVDGGMYPKVAALLWQSTRLRKRILLLTGGFHVEKNAMTANDKLFGGGGIDQLFVDSKIFTGEAMSHSASKGTHFSNGLYAHELAFQALHGELINMFEGEMAFTEQEQAAVLTDLSAVAAGGDAGVAAVDPTSALGKRLDKYRAYLRSVAARSGTASVWVQHLEFLDALLNHRRLIRNTPKKNCIELCIESLERLHSRFCAADAHWYAKILAAEIIQLSSLKEEFPYLYWGEQGQTENAEPDLRWLVSTNTAGKPGHGRAHDLVIEMLNGRVKQGKSGITKHSGDKDRMAAHLNSLAYLNVMGGAAKDFQAVRRRQLNGGKVEAGTSYLRRQRSLRERRELPDLRAVLQRPACNPFLRADAKYWNKLTAEEKKKEAETVFRVGTGVALDAKVARTLLNAHAIGCTVAQEMIGRLCKGGVSVWSRFTRKNVGTYRAEQPKQKKTHSGYKQMLGSLFFYLLKLLGSTGAGGVGPEELVRYPLTADGCPAMFDESGEMLPSAKAKWIPKLLGKQPAAVPDLRQKKAGVVFDLMAFIRNSGGDSAFEAGPLTIHQILMRLCTNLFKSATRMGGSVVVIVNDQYTTTALKDAAQRGKRGSSKHKVEVVESDTLIQSNACWVDFLKDSAHKRKLCKLMSKAVKEVLQGQDHGVTQCYLVNEGRGTKLSIDADNEAVHGLDCDIAEADAVVLRSAELLVTLEQDLQTVLIVVQDTDVLNGSVALGGQLCEQVELYLVRPRASAAGRDEWHDVKARREELASEHGEAFLDALLGAYSVSGVDTVERITSIGKVTAFNALIACAASAKSGNADSIQAMASMAAMGKEEFCDGEEELHSRNARGASVTTSTMLVRKEHQQGMETFLAHCYKQWPASNTAAELRIRAAAKYGKGDGSDAAAVPVQPKQKKQIAIEKVPPSPGEYAQHLLRAHYACMLWRVAMSTGTALTHAPEEEPSPLGYGWVWVDEEDAGDDSPTGTWMPVFSTMPPCPPALATMDVTGGQEDEGNAAQEEEDDGEEEAEDDEKEDEDDDDGGGEVDWEAEENAQHEREGDGAAEITEAPVPPKGWHAVAPKGGIDEPPERWADLLGATIVHQYPAWDSLAPAPGGHWEGEVIAVGHNKPHDEWDGMVEVRYTSDSGKKKWNRKLGAAMFAPQKHNDSWRVLSLAAAAAVTGNAAGPRNRKTRDYAAMASGSSGKDEEERPATKSSKTSTPAKARKESRKATAGATGRQGSRKSKKTEKGSKSSSSQQTPTGARDQMATRRSTRSVSSRNN